MDSSNNDSNSHLVESSSSSLLVVSVDGSLVWCRSEKDRFTPFGLAILTSLSFGTNTRVEEEESSSLEWDLG